METYPYVLCPWEVCWRLGSPAYMRRLWPEGISTLSCSLWMCGGWMLFGALWAGKGDCREDPVHITSIAPKEGSQGHLLSSKLFWLKHVGLRLGGLLEYVFIGLSSLVYRFIEFGLSVYRVWFIGLSGLVYRFIGLSVYRFIGYGFIGLSVYRVWVYRFIGYIMQVYIYMFCAHTAGPRICKACRPTASCAGTFSVKLQRS